MGIFQIAAGIKAAEERIAVLRTAITAVAELGDKPNMLAELDVELRQLIEALAVVQPNHPEVIDYNSRKVSDKQTIKPCDKDGEE